ncbi:hypothetical protein EV694_0832 [Volucribacter psittacicida]|uniref:Uncharacterized protein n=1 Tax=Volucribacter psittacicida TaxID=203482 RepID=A0A4R1G0F6_9PAST|nr:hypothetical protein [Volucribacter psittacicida]TCJ98428.1 hypothetical protein EV694_0832 [Volucribacter psittacicida]
MIYKRPIQPAQNKKLQKKLDIISQNFHQYLANQQFSLALQETLKAHKLIPASVRPLSDAATVAIYLNQWQDSIRYANRALQRDVNCLNAYDALAHSYGALKDWENAGKAGLKALQLRDQQYGSGELPPPTHIDLALAKKKKKVIAFSLFGGLSRYAEPAVLNTELCPILYPDWICRFYVDHSVPTTLIERLRQNGAEIVYVSEQQQQWQGTLWRFLAIDDPEVGYVIFRDADSVISQREAAAVNQWLASDKLFHTMRDSGSHTELILAGLWGCVAGAVPQLEQKIHHYIESKQSLSQRFADQYFLREQVWRYAKQSLFAHDRLFGFYQAQDFPNNEGFDYDNYHIGCNEGNAVAHLNVNYADGTQLEWTMYSSISPLLNLDGSINTQSEEREICRYTDTVHNQQIKVEIPRRYARGVSEKLTRFTVKPIAE